MTQFNVKDTLPVSFIQYLDFHQFYHPWMSIGVYSQHGIMHISDKDDESVFMQLSIGSKMSESNECIYNQVKEFKIDNDLVLKELELLTSFIGKKNFNMLNELVKSLVWDEDYLLTLCNSNSYSMEYLGKLINGESIRIYFTDRTKYKNFITSQLDSSIQSFNNSSR